MPLLSAFDWANSRAHGAWIIFLQEHLCGREREIDFTESRRSEEKGDPRNSDDVSVGAEILTCVKYMNPL